VLVVCRRPFHHSAHTCDGSNRCPVVEDREYIHVVYSAKFSKSLELGAKGVGCWGHRRGTPIAVSHHSSGDVRLQSDGSDEWKFRDFLGQQVKLIILAGPTCCMCENRVSFRTHSVTCYSPEPPGKFRCLPEDAPKFYRVPRFIECRHEIVVIVSLAGRYQQKVRLLEHREDASGHAPAGLRTVLPSPDH
jgi:hypothetical protein